MYVVTAISTEEAHNPERALIFLTHSEGPFGSDTIKSSSSPWNGAVSSASISTLRWHRLPSDSPQHPGCLRQVYNTVLPLAATRKCTANGQEIRTDGRKLSGRINGGAETGYRRIALVDTWSKIKCVL